MHDLLTLSSFDHLLLLAQLSPLALWSSVWPYLVMLLGFSLIVFVHELGHFAVAKWAGVRVEKFAIGFGREIEHSVAVFDDGARHIVERLAGVKADFGGLSA